MDFSFDLPDDTFEPGETKPVKEKKNKKRKATNVLESARNLTLLVLD